MNNTTYRAVSTTFLSIGAIVSAVLTCQFMYQLAQDAGASPILFAIIGLLLDGTKTYCPSLASRLLNKSMITALLLCVFTLGLSAISLSASVFAIDSGVESARENSREYTAYTKQITLLEDEIASLKALAVQQQDANQITKSSQTLTLVSAKSTTLAKLISEQATIKPAGLLSQYGNYISITIAALLEMLTLLLTLSLHHLKPNTYTSVRLDTPSVPSPVNTGGTPVNTLTVADASETVTPILKTPEVFVAKTESQIFAEVKAAIVNGVVNPTHRGINKMFKLKQEDIQQILAALYDEGVLDHKNEKGYYKLVTA